MTRFGVKLEDISSNEDTHNWISKYTPEVGFCYSYRVPSYLKVSVVQAVAFYAKTDIEIYLHHPGQFLTLQHYPFPMRANYDVYVEALHEVTDETLRYGIQSTI